MSLSIIEQDQPQPQPQPQPTLSHSFIPSLDSDSHPIRGSSNLSWSSDDPRVQTAAYTASFVVLGLMVGLIGPTLPSLRTNVGSTFEQLGIVFFGRWAGGIFGSLAAGWAIDHYYQTHDEIYRTRNHNNNTTTNTINTTNHYRHHHNKQHKPLVAAILASALGAAAIPRIKNDVVGIMVAFAIMDTGLGVLICYGNTLCTWANYKNPAPAINLLNGGFGCGAFIAPIIVMATHRAGYGAAEAYTVVSIVAIMVAATFLIIDAPQRPGQLDVHDQDQNEQTRYSNHSAIGSSSEYNKHQSSGKLREKRLVLILTMIFLLLVVGVEISFGAFLVTYVHGMNVLTHGTFAVPESEAHLITSAFWFVFTLSRLLGTSLAARVRPAPILAVSLGMVALALATIVATASSTWRSTLWLAAMLFGAGMSSCVAAAIAQFVAHQGLTGTTGGSLSAASGSGTIVQWAVSQLLTTPQLTIKALLAIVVAAVAIMAALWNTLGWAAAFHPVFID